MRTPCHICDGTGKLDDVDDFVTSMKVCLNCGGTGEEPLREHEEPALQVYEHEQRRDR